MFYISGPVDLQTLTQEQIREIVDVGLNFMNDGQALAFCWLERRFAIFGSCDTEISGLVPLVGIDAGVDDLDDEHKEQGIDQSAEFFKARCEAREVTVCVDGMGCMPWEAPWEARILELLAYYMKWLAFHLPQITPEFAHLELVKISDAINDALDRALADGDSEGHEKRHGMLTLLHETQAKILPVAFGFAIDDAPWGLLAREQQIAALRVAQGLPETPSAAERAGWR